MLKCTSCSPQAVRVALSKFHVWPKLSLVQTDRLHNCRSYADRQTDRQTHTHTHTYTHTHTHTHTHKQQYGFGGGMEERLQLCGAILTGNFNVYSKTVIYSLGTDRPAAQNDDHEMTHAFVI